MLIGVVGLVLALVCLGVFLGTGLPAEGEPYPNSIISFWLGIGCGVFFAWALSAFWNSRRRDRSRSEDATARIHRYGDTS